ncbi:MAG: hypothetical protein ACFCU9_04065 [Cyanophyceae cyanobacterium]
MTDEDLNQKFMQLTTAVERVAEASSYGLAELKENQKQFLDNQKKLQLAQLGTQAQIGLLSDMMRQSIERMDRDEAEMQRQQEATERHQAEMERLNQQQAEQDKRFDVLLAEIRYLIRRQFPSEDET